MAVSRFYVQERIAMHSKIKYDKTCEKSIERWEYIRR